MIGSSMGAHAVCVPFPAQGHINPMLQLAKLLHYKYGFYITFVNSLYNHNRFLDSRGPHSLDGLPRFRFESIPDGLLAQEDDDKGATRSIPALCRSTSRTCVGPFRDLVSRVNKIGPPVTCIVSDGAMGFTLKVAQEVGVPEVVFWTMSACGFMGYVQFRSLVASGLIPFKDASYLTNGYLDTPIDNLPGMKNVRLRDLPSFIRTTDPDDFMLNFMANEVEATSKASAIILNTFEALEKEVLEALSSIPNFPPFYSIGPLATLVDHHIPKEDPVNSINSSLWKEEECCIDWLDTKEPNSVLYVNFGSITIMTCKQLVEFAWGLANSKKHFLWVIRIDIVKGEFAILPQEFVDGTKGRGMLVSWCDQTQVLKHKSIGGFLTHSGWNSTLESICEGVPMICWPFFAEQQMNCRYSFIEWGVGMEIESDVKREEVEKLVRILMEEEKGKEMKRNATYWKNEVQNAIGHGMSSSKNLDVLVSEVMLVLKN